MTGLNCSCNELAELNVSGCTALAAFLARGFELSEAAARAKAYIASAIEAGASYAIGHGHGPVHHFHGFWE